MSYVLQLRYYGVDYKLVIDAENALVSRGILPDSLHAHYYHPGVFKRAMGALCKVTRSTAGLLSLHLITSARSHL